MGQSGAPDEPDQVPAPISDRSRPALTGRSSGPGELDPDPRPHPTGLAGAHEADLANRRALRQCFTWNKRNLPYCPNLVRACSGPLPERPDGVDQVPLAIRPAALGADGAIQRRPASPIRSRPHPAGRASARGAIQGSPTSPTRPLPHPPGHAGADEADPANRRAWRPPRNVRRGAHAPMFHVEQSQFSVLPRPVRACSGPLPERPHDPDQIPPASGPPPCRRADGAIFPVTPDTRLPAA